MLTYIRTHIHTYIHTCLVCILQARASRAEDRVEEGARDIAEARSQSSVSFGSQDRDQDHDREGAHATPASSYLEHANLGPFQPQSRPLTAGDEGAAHASFEYRNDRNGLISDRERDRDRDQDRDHLVVERGRTLYLDDDGGGVAGKEEARDELVDLDVKEVGRMTRTMIQDGLCGEASLLSAAFGNVCVCV